MYSFHLCTWLMSFLISCMFMSCFAHGWGFVCWPCACVFVLCEHVASVLVFCVSCALMSICLDPTHLVTCLPPSLPSSFAPFIISLCLQFRVGSSPYVVRCCLMYALCPVLSCPAFPLRGSFFIIINKPLFYLLQLGPRAHPLPDPDRTNPPS